MAGRRSRLPRMRLRGYGSMRGREIFASCAIWWSDCCCSPPTRWIARLSILPCPRRTAAPGARANGQTGLLAERVAGFERETILAELERNNRHITNTAKALGLERSYLYKKCQQLGIDLRRIQPRTQHNWAVNYGRRDSPDEPSVRFGCDAVVA